MITGRSVIAFPPVRCCAKRTGSAHRYAPSRVLPFLDHTSEAFATDPHGALRAAREALWIVETPTGLGVLTYAACNAVIADPGFRPGVFELMRRAGSGDTPVDAGRTLLGSEGVDHQ